MGFDDFLFWPFAAAFAGAMIIVAILVLIFWIWMLVDAAKRNFRNTAEKVVWIIVIVLGQWVGALVYFIVIKYFFLDFLFRLDFLPPERIEKSGIAVGTCEFEIERYILLLEFCFTKKPSKSLY